MLGRYYEEFEIDIGRGVSNYSQLLLDEAVKFISSNGSTSPFFLYWAPDSTHGPWYSSTSFHGSSARASHYGDALRELDDAVGQILDLLTKQNESPRQSRATLVIFTSDNGADLNARERAGSSGPLLCGKQTTFEGGMRSPTIAWWSNRRLGKVERRPSSHMDLLPTFADLAGVVLPTHLALDGVSIAPLLMEDKKVEVEERPVFFYRGNLLYAVRLDSYKAHFFTWTTGKEELDRGIDLCPMVMVPNVTTTDIRDHTEQPIIFHLGRDSGERFPLPFNSLEYQETRQRLENSKSEHVAALIPGAPVLNWCDRAVMNWSPPGCKPLGKCQKAPTSKPYLCYWPH